MEVRKTSGGKCRIDDEKGWTGNSREEFEEGTNWGMPLSQGAGSTRACSVPRCSVTAALASETSFQKGSSATSPGEMPARGVEPETQNARMPLASASSASVMSWGRVSG